MHSECIFCIDTPPGETDLMTLLEKIPRVTNYMALSISLWNNRLLDDVTD